MKQLGMFGENYAPARNEDAPEAQKKPPMPEEQLRLFFKGSENDVDQTFLCDPATGESVEPEEPQPQEEDMGLLEYDHRGSYCPEDNKLRFYPDWDDPDFDKEHLKAAGYRWASKQECYVCPRWTCTAEDAALDYVLEIEDENYSPTERAADRAERYAGYRDKRRQGAHSYADRMGDSVAGFQDQRKADRAARKRDRLAGHAVTQWDRAEYWQMRTAGVIGHAEYREQPDVRRRRIKKLESEQRKQLEDLEFRAKRLAAWKKVSEMEGADVLLPLGDDGYVDCVELNEAGRLAYGLANDYRSGVRLDHPRDEGANKYAKELHSYYAGSGAFSLYDLLTHDSYAAYGEIERLTPKEVAEMYLEQIADPDDEDSNGQRWKRHYDNRLAYENAMMENEGGNARDCDMVPGGWIYLPDCRSARHLRDQEGRRLDWVQVQKVNKSSASGKITSVTVHACSPYSYASAEDQKKIRSKVVKVDDAPANAYRAPTEEELEEFNATKKAKQAEAKKNGKKKPSLINPTDNDAERLQAIWNDRARQRWERAKEENPYISDFVESEVCRITQAQYSAVSKGSYARAETRTLHDGGFPSRAPSNMWSKSAQDYDQAIGAARCKIRQTDAKNSGSSGWYSANRVIVLTDKPQKELPIDWEAIPEEFVKGDLVG